MYNDYFKMNIDCFIVMHMDFLNADYSQWMAGR